MASRLPDFCCTKLTCEWVDCRETFENRLDFLRHITQFHVNRFESPQACKWEGCDCQDFDNQDHFKLHLSVHAYHHQLMFEGYKIMLSKSRF